MAYAQRRSTSAMTNLPSIMRKVPVLIFSQLWRDGATEKVLTLDYDVEGGGFEWNGRLKVGCENKFSKLLTVVK